MHKIEHGEPPASARFLDWAITVLTGGLIVYSVLNLGGVLPQTAVVQIWFAAAILLFHGIQIRLLPPNRRRIQPAGLLFVPLFVYLGLHVAFFSPVPWWAEEKLLNFLQAGILYWVAIHNIRTRGQIGVLISMLAAVALVCLAAGAYQLFRDPSWLPLGRVQIEQNAGRATGTFGAPNNFAALMGMFLVLFLYTAAVRRHSLPVRILCGYLSVLYFVGILFSGSRGSWIAFAAVLVVLPFFVFRDRVARIAGTAGIIVAMAVTGWLLYAFVDLISTRVDRAIVDRGETSRKFMWAAGWEIFRDNPVTGSGLASYQMLFERNRDPEFQMGPFYTHNDYLNTLSDQGLIGFFLLFGPAAGILAISWRAWKRKPFAAARRRKLSSVMPYEKWMLGGLLLGVFGFAVHLFVDFHLKIPALFFMIAVLFGWLIRFSAGRGTALPTGRTMEVLWVAIVGIGCALLVYRGTLVFLAAGYYYRGDERMLEYMESPDLRYEDPDLLPGIVCDLERAVTLNPKHGYAWDLLSLGMMESYYQVKENRLDYARKAKQAAARALAVSDQIWSAHARYGMALLMEDAPPEEVLSHFKRATELGPSEPSAWLYYAECLSFVSGSDVEAIDAVSRVLKLDPGNNRAIALKQRILGP